MNTKLTLSLNKQIIEQAKAYAKQKNISLSHIIENYLHKLTLDYKTTQTDQVSIVDELSGVVLLSNDIDYKKEYQDYLIKKHQ